MAKARSESELGLNGPPLAGLKQFGPVRPAEPAMVRPVIVKPGQG